jgi:hypothetical protein
MCVALTSTGGVAYATPIVRFKAALVPIPGHPGTGNIAGAGTAIALEFAISGTEYLGWPRPRPLIGLDISLPEGVALDNQGVPVHVIQLKGLVYREVSVYVNGHRVHVVRGARISAPVDLRGLPKGRYTVRITVATSSGRRITGTRSYHTCAAKPLHGGPHPL